MQAPRQCNEKIDIFLVSESKFNKCPDDSCVLAKRDVSSGMVTISAL